MVAAGLGRSSLVGGDGAIGGMRSCLFGTSTQLTSDKWRLELPPHERRVCSHLNPRMDADSLPWYRNLQDAQPFKLQVQLQVWDLHLTRPKTLI